MFTTTEPDDWPSDSKIAPHDWRILAGFWHPVAQTSEVGSEPFAVRLLDVPLVLYRTPTELCVARNQCPHRGTALSRGWMADGRLVCPMHGLAFDGAGVCRLIPSAADPEGEHTARISLSTVLAQERYGLIWVCLSGEPIRPLPEWPGIEAAGADVIELPPADWACSAPRHTENFNDVAHFPFVHRNTFGGGPALPVTPIKVSRSPTGQGSTLVYTEPENRFPDGAVRPQRDVVYEFELTYPFSNLLTIRQQDGSKIEYLADTACPTSAETSRIFQIIADNTGPPDADFWLTDQPLINEEDRLLVESQQPKALPLGTRSEAHIPADTVSLRYRRALMTEFGLGGRADLAEGD